MSKQLVPIVLLALLALLAGCVGPSVSSRNDVFEVDGTPHNVAVWDGEQWNTALHSMNPHNAIIDADGVNVQSSGQNTVIGVVMGDPPQFFTSNPADTTFDLMEYADGAIRIQNFASMKSSVIEEWAPSLIESLQTQGYITERQAEVWAELIESGQATLSDLVLNVLGGV